MFNSLEDLEASIESYFDNPPTRIVVTNSGNSIEIKCPTITGLALHLGFMDRQSIYDYQEKEEYTCAIKKARLRIESNYETNLSGGAPTGSIFALKNFGWKDKIEQELSGSLSLTGLTDTQLDALIKQQAAALGLTISGQVTDSDSNN